MPTSRPGPLRRFLNVFGALVGAPAPAPPRADLSALSKRLSRAAALMRPGAGSGAATDSWVNTSSGVGVAGRDRQTDTRFITPAPVSRDLALALWKGSNLTRRLVGKRAAVALSRGVELSATGAEVTWLHAELRRVRALPQLQDARTWGNLYGGALLIANCDGGGPADTELDLGQLRQVVNLRVVDRWQVQRIDYATPGPVEGGRPATTSTLSRDGEPVLYHLQPGASGAAQAIHASRVWRFDGARLPFEGRRANAGWDDSVLVGLQGALSRRGIGLAALATQLHDANVGVWKIKGFHEMVLSGGKDVDAWLEAMMLFRGVLGDYALDADSEDFSYKSKPLADSREVLQELLFDLAAEADMPFTELYGMSPAGMNATGEGDRRKWHETIDSAERPVFGEALGWLLTLLQAQSSCPFDLRGADVTLTWPSLEVLTAAEEEERRTARANAAVSLVEAGLLSREEARRTLRVDPVWVLDDEVEGGGGEGEDASGAGADPEDPEDDPTKEEEAADAARLTPQALLAGPAALQVGAAVDGPQGDGSKVGLFLRLPPELAAAIPPLGAEDDSPPHITLLAVGDLRGREAEFFALLRGALTACPPFCRGLLGPLDALTNREGQVVLFQHVAFNVPAAHALHQPLHRFRAELVARLRQRHFPLRDLSPDAWLPHLTRAYLPDPAAAWTGAPLAGSWAVSELEVWGLPDGPLVLRFDGASPASRPEPLEAATDADRFDDALARALSQRAEHMLTMPMTAGASAINAAAHYRQRFTPALDMEEAAALAALLLPVDPNATPARLQQRDQALQRHAAEIADTLRGVADDAVRELLQLQRSGDRDR